MAITYWINGQPHPPLDGEGGTVYWLNGQPYAGIEVSASGGSVSGSASQTIDIDQSATATLTVQGSADQSILIAQSATGEGANTGQASQAIEVLQTATADPIIAASASQPIDIAQTSTAALTIVGSATQAVTVTQDASSSVAGEVEAAASQDIAIGQSATATMPIVGEASQPIGLGQIASGQVTGAGASGVSRLARSQKFVPQPRVVGLFFRPPPTPAQIKPDGGGKPIKAPPAPEVAELEDDAIERHAAMLEHRLSAVERKLAEKIAAAERRIATVTLLDKKRQELNAVRDELSARKIKKQIQAEDELILMLLAA